MSDINRPFMVGTPQTMSRRTWLAVAGGAGAAAALAGGISVAASVLRSQEIDEISGILRRERVAYFEGMGKRQPLPSDGIKPLATVAYFRDWRAAPLDRLIRRPDFPSSFSYAGINVPVKTHLVAIPLTKGPSINPLDFGIDHEGGYLNIVVTARAPNPAVQNRLFQFGRRFFAEYARAEVLADKPLVGRDPLNGYYLLGKEFRKVLIDDFIAQSQHSLTREVAEVHFDDEMFFLNLRIAHAWGAGNRFLDREAVEFLTRNFLGWRFGNRYPTQEQMERVLRVVLRGDLAKLNLLQLALYDALGQKYGFKMPPLAEAIEAAADRAAIDYFYALTQTYAEQFDQAEAFFGPKTVPI